MRYDYTSLSKRAKGGNVPFLCKNKTSAAKKIRELKCCGPGAPWLPGMYRELLICFPAVIASIAVWLSIGLAVWRLIQTTKQTNKRWPTRQDALFSALAVACGRPDTVRIGGCNTEHLGCVAPGAQLRSGRSSGSEYEFRLGAEWRSHRDYHLVPRFSRVSRPSSCVFVNGLLLSPRSLTLRNVSIQKRSSRISQLSITQNDIILQDTNL